ncbi:MAG TPA: family 78 glycoside hydrolase catalytic domain [Mycobacteriales bacterium]|nr:family 78 glycoside hydrolase catalytic domain [Mycobacteriales bacterium]
MPAPAVLTAVDLRTESRTDPLGLDEPAPQLSWKLTGSGRARSQRGYHIVVAAEHDPIGTDAAIVWDTGQVASADSSGIGYAGPALKARTRYLWRVRITDEHDQVSGWSALASFETGLLSEPDWSAGWIAAANEIEPPVVSLETARSSPALRRIWVAAPDQATHRAARARISFAVPPGARLLGAALTVGGAGELTVTLNGAVVPAVGDVLAAVRTGENVLAVSAELGDGDPVGFVGRLEVWLESQRSITVDTDAKWRAVPDADAGWELPGFDDESWPLAETVGTHGAPPRGREAASYRPSPYLRREFTVEKPVRRARVYSTALGIYQLQLNGAKVGVDHLSPGWTDYAKRVPYQTYDVTESLTQGPNVIGAILADGWYAGNICWFGQFQYGRSRMLRAQLEIEYEDGSRSVVETDEQWTAGTGGLQYADLQNGVVDDARLEPAGWSNPGFAGEFGAVTVESPTHGPLEAEVAPPVRVKVELPALSVEHRGDGRIFVDFGQNLVGWVRLRVTGSAGQRLILRHAEKLQADNELYTIALRSASATDEYVLRGDPDGEVFEPRFTVHGFRYLEITGFPGELKAEDVIALVAFADMEQTGDFRCSHQPLEKLQQNIVWGQRGNFLSVPTDCPQRDERLGWTGDAQVFAGTSAFNYDVRGFFRKWLTDLIDAQRPNGAVTHVAPDVLTPGAALRNPAASSTAEAGGAGWGDAIEIIPIALHRVFGDPRFVAETYTATCHWLTYLERTSVDLIRENPVFGDWLAIANTPGDLVATAFFAFAAKLAAESARLLDRDTEADRWDELFGRVRKAFRARFVEGGGRVVGGSQTAYVLALHFGLLDADEIPRAAAHLVTELESRNWHLTTGFLGTPYLLSALSEAGHLDAAYLLLLQDTFPSWLYPVVHGDATTIWERWDSWSDSRGFQDPGMTSFNHYAYGAVGDWIYRNVGGIADAAPGYRESLIRPRPGGGLSWARTSYESVYGRIATSWQQDGSEFSLEVTIPPNTTAEVWVPTSDPGSIRESGADPAEAAGVTRDREVDGAVVYRVGSGQYMFRSAHSDSGV